jgi:hypothetical protein
LAYWLGPIDNGVFILFTVSYSVSLEDGDREGPLGKRFGVLQWTLAEDGPTATAELKEKWSKSFFHVGLNQKIESLI